MPTPENEKETFLITDLTVRGKAALMAMGVEFAAMPAVPQASP